MTPTTSVNEPAAPRKRHRSWLQAGRPTPLPRHFSWRLLLLRFAANAVALAISVVVVPEVWFAGDYRILSWLAISAVFGLLNAFIKPIVQVIMLPFMFVSFGLVVILINAILLWFLDVLFPERFQVGSILWALLGGFVFSIIAGFLENMLGLTPPIFEGEPKEVRDEIERRKHGLVDAQILAVAAKPLAHNHAAATEPEAAAETVSEPTQSAPVEPLEAPLATSPAPGSAPEEPR